MKEKSVSLKTKASIAGALGYCIFPLDAVPDLMPLVGFTDGPGVLIFALTQVSSNVSPEIKAKAKKQLKEWFGSIDEAELNNLSDSLL